MNLFHDFIRFFFAPVFGCALDAAGGGAAGAAAGAAGTATGDAGAAAGGASGGAGGGGAAAGAGSAAVGTVATGALIGADGKFTAGWSKQLGGTDALEAKFTDPKALVGSYLALEKMISAKGIIPPGPDATAEQKAAFHKALGRPDKPEEYGVKMPEKIGDKAFPKELWSDDRAKAFTTRAHELGLTKEQVAALVEFDASQGLSLHESMSQADTKARSDAITALKSEWGSNYDANLKLAQTAAKEAGGAELLAHPLANDPMFIKAMAKVGGMISETPAAGARGTTHSTVSPEAEIAQIMNDKSHPWQPDFARKGHSAKAHADAVAHMQNLYRRKTGEAA